MEIEIRKTQETVNDVIGETRYTILIKRHYGTGDIHHTKDDWLVDFNEEDMQSLARKLADRFLPPTLTPTP